MTRTSIRESEAGRAAEGWAERLHHFQQGETLAQRACAIDVRVADARIALLCVLGERLRLDGESRDQVHQHLHPVFLPHKSSNRCARPQLNL